MVATAREGEFHYCKLNDAMTTVGLDENSQSRRECLIGGFNKQQDCSLTL